MAGNAIQDRKDNEPHNCAGTTPIDDYLGNDVYEYPEEHCRQKR